VRYPDFAHEDHSSRRPHHVAPNLATVRVVFVIHRYKTPMNGSDSGLGVTINSTARVLRRNGVHAESWDVLTIEDLFSRLERDHWQSERRITHVVVNTPNFVPPEKFGELAQRWHDIEFVQLNHTGLAYLCIDRNGPKDIRAVLDLQRSTHNIKVAGNNPRFEWFDLAYGVKPLLLPNLYDCDTFVAMTPARRDTDPLRIGCFGENRPWKNQGIAAMAGISIARRLNVQLEFYVNADRWEQTWPYSRARAELYDNLPGCKLTTIPWLPWAQFRRLIGTMDLCVHPSWDETFCCVVADGIAEGVPSVVTGAMEWAPRTWRSTEPFDPANVAAVGLQLLHDRANAVHDGRRALQTYVKEGIRLWIDYLTD